MKNEKRDLLEKIKETGVSIYKISKQIDIPATRMYKWYDEKGMPKHEDYLKLLKWYENFQKVPHETLSTEVAIEDRATIKMLIQEMAKIKAKVSGVSVASALDEMRQNTSLIIEEMKQAQS